LEWRAGPWLGNLAQCHLQLPEVLLQGVLLQGVQLGVQALAVLQLHHLALSLLVQEHLDPPLLEFAVPWPSQEVWSPLGRQLLPG